ncbi:hypothetical protein BJV78DRAFT_1212123 [Lactifluus subvellereus]|nr:hypothetical protein BJV78DRAFT_1212123 [Lactifluus subvellereus]
MCHLWFRNSPLCRSYPTGQHWDHPSLPPYWNANCRSGARGSGVRPQRINFHRRRCRLLAYRQDESER